MGKYMGAFCDLCQRKDGSVTSYEIKTPDGKLVLDLCEEHEAPIKALRDKAPAGAWIGVNGTHRGGRRRTPRVIVDPSI